MLGLYYSLSLLLLLGTRGVEEVGRGLLDVVAGLRRVVGRELGEEPRPEAPGPRPELARVRDHETVRVLARLVEATHRPYVRLEPLAEGTRCSGRQGPSTPPRLVEGALESGVNGARPPRAIHEGRRRVARAEPFSQALPPIVLVEIGGGKEI